MNEVVGAQSVAKRLRLVGTGMVKAALAAADEIAHLLEAYAKSNHLWKPQTGNTDNSTRGFVAAVTEDTITIVLSAGMSYDVFLELARSGKWAWLWPAVEANRERIREILAKHLREVRV